MPCSGEHRSQDGFSCLSQTMDAPFNFHANMYKELALFSPWGMMCVITQPLWCISQANAQTFCISQFLISIRVLTHIPHFPLPFRLLISEMSAYSFANGKSSCQPS